MALLALSGGFSKVVFGVLFYGAGAEVRSKMVDFSNVHLYLIVPILLCYGFSFFV